jgi:hypothetical protein
MVFGMIRTSVTMCWICLKCSPGSSEPPRWELHWQDLMDMELQTQDPAAVGRKLLPGPTIQQFHLWTAKAKLFHKNKAFLFPRHLDNWRQICKQESEVPPSAVCRLECGFAMFCHVLPCFAFGPVAYKAALTSVACLPRWCNQSSTSLQAVAAMQHVMRSPANFPVSKHVQSVAHVMLM